MTQSLELPTGTPTITKRGAAARWRGLASVFGLGVLGIGLVATVVWLGFLAYIVSAGLWTLL
jgi:hypothetical protein